MIYKIKTKAQRKKLYQAMLDKFTRDPEYREFLCLLARRMTGNELKSKYTSMIQESVIHKKLPELFAQRPKEADHAWWDTRIRKQRITALKRAIKLCDS